MDFVAETDVFKDERLITQRVYVRAIHRVFHAKTLIEMIRVSLTA